MLDLDIIKIATERAVEYVQTDRDLYKPIFIEVESYITSNPLILGVDTSIAIGKGVQPILYEVFSHDALKQIKGLADIVFRIDPEGLTRYTNVTTKLEHKQFSLQVNGRDIAFFINLPKHHGVEIFNVVMPIFQESLLTKKPLACASTELQLIQLYMNLSNPKMASEWICNMEDEKRIRKIFLKDFRIRLPKIIEGGSSFDHKQKKKSRRDFYDQLNSEFIYKDHHAIVGNLAIRPNDRGRIQLITSLDINVEVKTVYYIGSQNGFNIQWCINPVRLPIDTRLQKATLFFVENDKKEPFMDIFNNAFYDLVPYSIKTKIASVIVLLKYILIDIWTIQTLIKMHVIDKSYAEDILKNFIVDFEELSEELDEPSPKLFPFTFLGSYDDEALNIRRKSVQFYPPYYPLNNILQKNTTNPTTITDSAKGSLATGLDYRFMYEDAEY